MRRFLGEVVALVVVVAVLAAGGVAFSLPWRAHSPAAGTDLERYVVDRNGSSYLRVKTDADGNRVSWSSDNVIEEPGFTAITGWPEEFNDALEPIVAEQPGADQIDQLQEVRAFETRNVQLEDNALQPASSTYTALTRDGLFLFGFYRDETQTAELFDPPALLLPPDLSVGSTFSTEGTYLGSATYTIAGEVTAAEAQQTPLGEFDDCIEVESSFAVTSDGDEQVFRFRENMCAGVGSVVSNELDADGNVTSTTTTIATDRIRPAGELPGPVPTVAEAADLGDPATWKLRRMGRAAPTYESTEPTFRPLYVPADPPYVLAASVVGDLRAMSPEGGGEVIWRYQPGGAVYGEPVVDAESGRIYFGAADKKLYALDSRGIFLWAFETGDNIASRPLIAGDRVVFGSEDRRVYAVDSATGAEMWHFDADAAITSSPALHGDTVVIGSDDGGVYGISLITGAQLWVHDAGDPVTSAVTVDDGVAYFGTIGGRLAAVDAETGDELWSAEDLEPLSAPIAVSDGRVHVVDEFGAMFTFDAGDGELRWRSRDFSYSYAAEPLVVPAGIVIGHYEEPTVHLIDAATGDAIAEWDATESQGATDAAAYFKFGASTGGGAIWIVDNGVVLRRLAAMAGEGGERPQREPLAPVWLDPASDPPFAGGNVPAYTPLEYDGSALLIDYATNVYLVDPADGTAQAAGTVASGAGNPYAGATVAGDVLLVGAQGKLYAASLPDVAPLWTFEGVGIAAQAPLVVGDTVLWVNTDEAERRVYALSLADGSLLWEVDLPGAFIGGVAVSGDTVFTGPGALALDLATGEQKWGATVASETQGIPTVSADGTTVYIGGVTDTSEQPTYALDAATGTARWTAQSPEPLSAIEQVWESDGVVVLPSITGAVVGLDAASGEILWTHEPPRPRLGTVTVDDGLVWFATEVGQVFVLDAATGEVAYEFTDLDFPLGEYSYAQRPTRIGDTMIFALGFFVIGFEVPTAGGQ